MCGIFGYIGKRDPLKTCLQGLKLLEYRGYDSSGISGLSHGELVSFKEVGKVSVLEEQMTLLDPKLDLAIAHTRWATHGKPNKKNAHPHSDEKSEISVIHNGIIENFDQLRQNLQSKGVVFTSETDTEVIAQLLADQYDGDLLSSICRTLEKLVGSFGLALIHKNHPDTIVAASRESPLAIGYDDQHSEVIISSDPNAFLGHNLNVFYLKNDEIAIVRRDSVIIYDMHQKPIQKKTEKIQAQAISFSKEGFDHYMLKEIFEQPFTVQKAMIENLSENGTTAEFKNLSAFPIEELKKIGRVLIIGCGTSWHAGCIAASLFEEMAHLPASAEIASEFRYKTPLIAKDTLVIAISQSGETADTLGAIRIVKEKGIKVLGICNVKNSTMTREVDGCIFLHAGPEFSVCSTKAFTSQLTQLAMLALYIARLGPMSEEEGRSFLNELKTIPEKIGEVLSRSKEIELLAKKYSTFKDFFFLGRRMMVPTCMESALKLKEISYLNASAYPAGEMKHGPIALISPSLPIIAFCQNEQTLEKMASNLMEVKARGAPILAFASIGAKGLSSIADDLFFLPSTIDLLAPFVSTPAGQLFAYFIAKELGTEIDKPRNLAKSVTVE
jgi:glucosamine--fructose-6-phosphate aminotransferase (isomerizing)